MHLTLSHLRLFIILSVLMSLHACTGLRAISAKPNSKAPMSPAEGELRDQITYYALQQEGAKYKYGAKGPSHFDCSGFVGYVYAKYDVPLPGGSTNQAKLGKQVPLSDTQPGDLVFFGRGGKINHVALVLRNSSEGIEVIHSTNGSGVIQENISQSDYWKKRILFARNVIAK
jgi:cell wall-associated NlpC family hydrolase